MVNNNILIRTPDDLVVDIIRPKRLVAIGESYEGLMFSVASYTEYGMVEIKSGTGLVISNGILEIEADRFVEKDQGVENYNKFLCVQSDGKVGLTQAGGIPTKTSDLQNDGDGESPFLTENSYITRARIIVMFNEED